jgi:ribosomal protein S18 acetylase RimI-like enzyme
VTVTIRPAAEDELSVLLADSRRQYAREMVEHGGFEEDAADEKADADFETVLKLPTQQYYVVEDDGAVVGRLWLAEREQHGQPLLFVYDVRIDEEQRGRGLGRAAMRLAEDEARSRGLTRIELNVWGGNDVARGLYRSIGYEEVGVYMRKELA